MRTTTEGGVVRMAHATFPIRSLLLLRHVQRMTRLIRQARKLPHNQRFFRPAWRVLAVPGSIHKLLPSQMQ